MRKQVESNDICSECGTVLKRGKEEYFCDVCNEKIPEHFGGNQITVFFEDSDTTDYDVCSWKCVAKWLRDPPVSQDMIQFITIPYITGYSHTFSKNLKEFLQAFQKE